MLLTLVAWLNDFEWYTVYKNLFYGNREQKIAALNQIKLWRCRVGADIHVAIEITSRLMECQIELPSIKNDNVKQQMLGSSVSQFIGLITESGLKGSGPSTRKPIHVVGEEMGIPHWIVHLRHGTAHGLLPSTNMLQKAFEFAIEWIKESYWDQQARYLRYLDDEETGRPEERNMVDVLKQYCICTKRETYPEKFDENASVSSNVRMTIFKKLKLMMDSDETSRKSLCHILFTNNLLTYEANADIVQVAIKNNTLPSFPSHFKKCWRLILYYIHSNDLLFKFVIQVISEIEYYCRFSSLARVDWYTACFDMIFTTMNNELIQFPIKFWNILFKKVCCGHILLYKELMLKEMLNCVKYSCSVPQFKALLKLTNVEEELDENDMFLLQSNPVSRATSVTDQFTSDGPWKLCEDQTFEDCSLGLLSGQDMRTLQNCLLAKELRHSMSQVAKEDKNQIFETHTEYGGDVIKTHSIFNNTTEQWGKMAQNMETF